MKKEYNIIGLDCGHCALTLEKYIASIKGIKECNINFSTSKLSVDIDDDNYKSIIKEMFKLSKQVNPDVTITEEKLNDTKLPLVDIILYSIGLILGFLVLFVSL